MKGALGMVTQGVSSLEVDEMMVGERERGVGVGVGDMALRATSECEQCRDEIRKSAAAS